MLKELLKVGMKIKIGENYFVVIALANETGNKPLLRNLKDKTAIYLPDNIDYSIVGENEIIYVSEQEDIEKKKKKDMLLNQNLDYIIKILSNCNVEFNNLINKVSTIRAMEYQKTELAEEYQQNKDNF